MCKCCKAIKELQEIENERKENKEIKHILKARLTSITRKKGIKKEIRVINFESYDLNYCPVCGKKIDDDKMGEKNIKTVREFLIDILSSKIRKKKIKIRYGAGYYTFYVEDFEFIKDCSGTGLVIGKILDEGIEVL